MVKKTMFKIEAEWDFGHADLVFDSDVDALRWLAEDENVADLCNEMDTDLDSLLEQGLINVLPLRNV